MKSVCKYLVISFAAFAVLLQSCSRFDSDVTVLAEGEAEHTLIMYLLTDNNLGSNIIDNATAAEEGTDAGTLPSCRLVVYFDRSDKSELYEVKYRPYGTGDFFKEANLLKTYPKQTSTDPEVMKSVFEDIKTLSPSRSYGVVFSGHGTGWFPKLSSGTSYNSQKTAAFKSEYQLSSDAETKFYGYDNNDWHATTDSNFMSAEEMREGMSPIHFDYVIFDACFMSSIEYLYSMRRTADYFIVSPVEVMSAGFPYENIIPLLFSQRRNLLSVAETIVDVYENTNYSSVKSVAVALVDCSALDGLAVATKHVYDAPRNTVNLSQIQALERMKVHAFYDMNGYLSALCSDSDIYADYLAAFRRAVLYADNTDDIYSYGYSSDGYSLGYDFMEQKVGGSLNLCGVSCYVPIASAPITASCYYQTEWAKAVCPLNP